MTAFLIICGLPTAPSAARAACRGRGGAGDGCAAEGPFGGLGCPALPEPLLLVAGGATGSAPAL